MSASPAIAAPHPASTSLKIAARASGSAAVGFLASVCTGNLAGLRAALANEPRFLEAQLFIGRQLAGIPPPGSRARTAIATRPTTRDGLQALKAALDAFPESLSAAMDLATLLIGRDYREAHRLFASVTSRVPTHHDAWFGDGTALSYLKDYDAAIVAFTRVLELGRWHVGDSLYWRAWNRHQLKDLDRAWADVEESKKTLYNTNVFALAGFIAYDRNAPRCRADQPREGPGDRHAQLRRGLVPGTGARGQTRWPDAAHAFEGAAACYSQDIVIARTQIAQAEASDGVRRRRPRKSPKPTRRFATRNGRSRRRPTMRRSPS